MSESNTGQAQAAETLTQETKTFIRQVRTKTRRKYAPEDKIRIVLEGFRREVTVSDLCRREGIKPGVFYAWTKEFMEAGKERLTRDTVRDATRQEIEHLKRENYDLKQLVANRVVQCSDGGPKDLVTGARAKRQRVGRTAKGAAVNG